MTARENITPYGSGESKGAQVEQMFNHIAPTYDRLNHRMSYNIDRRWRRKAVETLRSSAVADPRLPTTKQTLGSVCSYKRILDIASGTGDFAILMAQQLRPELVLATDIAENMMAVGREKVGKLGLEHTIRFQREDALCLSMEEGTFDAVTATFGIRNFPDLRRGLQEMHRVLKGDGRLTMLELTTPKNPVIRLLYRAYSKTILPLYGKYVAHDKEAYQYLIKSIEHFPQAEEMMNILQDVGFRQTQYRRLSLGICTLYTAVK